MNSINIIGRLTKNPELRTTQAGTPVASFSIACNKYFTKNGEKVEQVSFFNVVAWNGTGEMVTKWFATGDEIALSGELQQRRWKDQDGNNRQVVEIIAHKVYFTNGKKKSDGDSQQPSNVMDGTTVDNAPEYNPFSDDDMPF